MQFNTIFAVHESVYTAPLGKFVLKVEPVTGSWVWLGIDSDVPNQLDFDSQGLNSIRF